MSAETDDVRVGVVGAGYVGLTTAVCLAERGLDTVWVDVDRGKLDRLNAGVAVIDEPELQEVLRSGLSRGTLRFTADYAELCGSRRRLRVRAHPEWRRRCRRPGCRRCGRRPLGSVLRPGAVIALKSTVPVGTTRRARERCRGSGIRVVSTPEFLREGHAVTTSAIPTGW